MIRLSKPFTNVFNGDAEREPNDQSVSGRRSHTIEGEQSVASGILSDLSISKMRLGRSMWAMEQRLGDNVASDAVSIAFSVQSGGVSDFGLLEDQTVGENTIEAVAFDDINKNVQATIQEKAVRTVVKLCFSSLAVVFQETTLCRDPEQPPFQYNRIQSIPTEAARMLWSELLGGIECQMSAKTDEYMAKMASSELAGNFDASINANVVRSFLGVANRKETKGALALLRNGKNLFKRKEAEDSEQIARNIETMDDKKRSKDPFLFFVRQQLLKTKLVEINGRRFDDSVQTFDDWDGGNEEDDSTGSLDEEAEMDTSGWKGRASRKFQSLEIPSEIHYKYGVMLSAMSLKAGGFALPTTSQESDSVERNRVTMRRWDEKMADACARKLHSYALLEPRLVEKESGEEEEVEDEPWMKVQSNNPFGDGATYALKMYPTHLMRGNCVVDAARTLMSSRYFLGRMIALGIMAACDRHRADLEELCLRSEFALDGHFELGGDGAGIDAEDITFATLHVMSIVVAGRFDAAAEQSPVSAEGRRLAGERRAGDAGRAMHIIAASFAEKGDFAQATDCFMKAITYKKAALGSNHVSVARSYRQLGQCYLRERECDDAVEWFSEALQIERDQDVNNFERVASDLASIALVYGLLNDHEKAVEYYGDALDIQKQSLGENHVKVADTLNSLGIVYGLMGDLEKAVEHYLDAIAIKEKQENVYDDQIADLQFNLGLVYGKRGDNAAAVNCFQCVLRTRRERYGDDDKEVGRTYHHLGEALADLGKLDDSLESFEEAYRIRKECLGDEHEEVAETLQCMGLVYYEHGDLEMALSFIEDALRIFQRRFGLRSEKAADSLHAMGLVYHSQTRYDEAIRYYENALQIRQACLGVEHIQVASTHHSLGDVYFMQGDIDNAMNEYSNALQIRDSHYGKGHEEVATTLNNMGVALMKQGNQNDAIECFNRALDIRQSLLGDDNIKCSDTLHNMGLVHKNNQEYEKAIERYDDAIRIRRLVPGDNVKVADSLYNLAIVYSKMGSYSEALSIYQEAQTIYGENGLTDDHPSVAHTLQWIKWCQRKLAKAIANNSPHQV